MKPTTPPPPVLKAMARLNDRLAEQESDPEAAAQRRDQAQRHRAAAAEAGMPDWPEALRVQMEAVLHDQAELLDETQKMMAAWTKRRQDAMEAGFRTLRKLSDSKDASEIAAAYGEWLTSSMGRIIADMIAAQDGALRLANLGHSAITALGPKGTAPASPLGVRPKKSDPPKG